MAPGVKGLRAYHVAPARGMVKLDAMENPYTPPQWLVDRWQEEIAEVALNRYPDPQCADLKSAIRERFDVPRSCEVLLGNGSDELIQLIAILLGGRDRTFVTPEPGFSMYRQICTATGTGFAGVDLDPDFGLDGERMVEAIRRHNPACVFIAYPNNPTGNCFDQDVVEQVISLSPGLVVVDEAYFAFCGKTWLSRISDYPNLVVLRTLSKSGLAGIRVGMLFGNPEWTSEMEKLRLPYNINSLSQFSARFYLEHQDVLDEQAAVIVENREKLYEALQIVPGLTPYPSATNFVLVRIEGSADDVYRNLQDRGVLVRNLHEPGTALDNCLRVTVGTEDENNAMLAAISRIMAGVA